MEVLSLEDCPTLEDCLTLPDSCITALTIRLLAAMSPKEAVAWFRELLSIGHKEIKPPESIEEVHDFLRAHLGNHPSPCPNCHVK